MVNGVDSDHTFSNKHASNADTNVATKWWLFHLFESFHPIEMNTVDEMRVMFLGSSHGSPAEDCYEEWWIHIQVEAFQNVNGQSKHFNVKSVVIDTPSSFVT